MSAPAMRTGTHKRPETARFEPPNGPPIAANSSSRSSDVLLVLSSRRSGGCADLP